MGTQTFKVTLDSGALLFGRVVGLLLGIIRLNYLATHLGVANFGILNFAAYFTALFQVFFDLGLTQLLTRDMARDRTRGAELLGQLLVPKLATALLAALVLTLIVLAADFDPTTRVALLLTTAALTLNSLGQTFLGALQAYRKMVLVAVSNILNDSLLSVAIIVLIPRFPEVATALLLTAGVAALNLTALTAITIRVVGAPHLRYEPSATRLVVREGLPIAISGMAIAIYTYIGPTLLRYMRGDVEVGIFSAGYKLISILTLVPVAFTQVLYPIFSDFFTNAPGKVGKALQDSLRVMSEISFPLAVGTVILAPSIIDFLYPSAFAEAALVLQLMVLGNALGFLGWILYTFMLALHRQRLCMWVMLGAAAAVTAANVSLIPEFGHTAVAGISFLNEWIIFGILFLSARRMGYGVSLAGHPPKLILATLGMGLAVYVSRHASLALVVPAGICIYIVLMLALRAIGDQERELLSRFINR